MNRSRRALILLTLVGTTLSCRSSDPGELPPLDHGDETVPVPGTDIAFDMVAIPGKGRLLPFSISRHEVTWGQFDRFYEFPDEIDIDGITRPSPGKNYIVLSGYPNSFLNPDRPVTGLRYYSALIYCEWLSRKTGMIFRLPTEAEWEAARGPLPASFAPHAWFESNSDDRTHGVGRKKANRFGLHDMVGNAWEYCLEPRRPPGYEPVLRGGAWNTAEEILKADVRLTEQSEWFQADPVRPFSTWWFRAGFSQGFRVVRVPTRAGRRSREAYARKIRITEVSGKDRILKVGRSTFFFVRVAGEVRNEGDRPLVELAVKAYALTPDGKPHLEDVSHPQSRRPTFGIAYPALVNSAHPGPHSRPLSPGESRPFSVDIPISFDPDEDVQPGAFGAEVLHLRFAP